jgi:hypothetical protein
VSTRDSPLEHVTPYDRFAWHDAEVEAHLAAGTRRDELIAYFGAAEYRVLAALAHRAQRAAARNAARVLLVPGIMGSQLGLARAPPLPDDILWLDPIDIQLGRLRSLRVPGARIVPLGVVLFSYLRLRLHLRAAGFAVDSYDYDWRQPVSELGRALAEHLARSRGPVALVAHSMGGLVSRAALALAEGARVVRLILLGTPNCGSFAAVQALRGTYAVVRKIARLDAVASAETLSAETFGTFPSLYDLLPHGACGGPDLFAAENWPDDGPRPRAVLLAGAKSTRARLAPPDARFFVIAGAGQVTVTGVARRADEFVYTLTRAGDGTVPLMSATLPGVPAYYARAAHSELTRDPLIARAVADLLQKQTTRRLPSRWVSRSRASLKVSDAQLRQTHAEKVDWGEMSETARRQFLETLNEPPHRRLRR